MFHAINSPPDFSASPRPVNSTSAVVRAERLGRSQIAWVSLVVGLILAVSGLPAEAAEPLPDGLHELANHNLITFKSFQEALSPWAVQELIGH